MTKYRIIWEEATNYFTDIEADSYDDAELEFSSMKLIKEEKQGRVNSFETGEYRIDILEIEELEE